VGEHHVEFELFNDEKPSCAFACCGCETIDSNEPMNLLDTNLSDPSDFSCALFEGFGLDDDRVTSYPPNVIETESFAVDEGYLSSCCRFITLWISMPPKHGGV